MAQLAGNMVQRLLDDDADVEETQAGDESEPADSGAFKVGKNVQKFRMRLWNHLIGAPMDSTAMADCCASHSELIRIAESNTRALHQVYPKIPHDDYPTFAAMEAAVEQHG